MITLPCPACKTACITPCVQAFSDRAGSAKKEVGMEDVMLAIQAKATTSFVTPPAQDVSATLTRQSSVFVVQGLMMSSGKARTGPCEC